MIWLDYGPARQLADKPTVRGGTAPTLASLRPGHPTITWDAWTRSLPREAWVREDDVIALQIAEKREQIAAEQRDGPVPSKPVDDVRYQHGLFFRGGVS